MHLAIYASLVDQAQNRHYRPLYRFTPNLEFFSLTCRDLTSADVPLGSKPEAAKL